MATFSGLKNWFAIGLVAFFGLGAWQVSNEEAQRTNGECGDFAACLISGLNDSASQNEQKEAVTEEVKPATSQKSGTLHVKNSPACEAVVQGALILLENTKQKETGAPRETYRKFVETHLNQIVIDNDGRGRVDTQTGTYFEKQAECVEPDGGLIKDKKILMAGRSSHEACHVWRKQNGKTFEGEEAEEKCLRVQIDVWKQLGINAGALDKYYQDMMATRWWAPEKAAIYDSGRTIR